MKTKKVFISFMAVVVLVAFAQIAMAAYTITIDQVYSSGNGGEFRISGGLPFAANLYDSATKNQGGETPSFQTFCVETNEYFSPGGTYSATLSNAAILGGVGGGSPDPVSKGTADLYYQFARGILANYNYGDGRTNSAAALQQAIWVLENEIANDPGTNIFLNAIIGSGKTYVDLSAARADNAGLFPVMALNVWQYGKAEQTNYAAQDMLVVVPIPAAVWLLGTGLVGLVVVRRRMKK